MILLRIFLFGFLLLSAGSGYWLGNKDQTPCVSEILPAEEFPLTEYKSFAIIVYACNQAPWCERALRSFFEQDYDHYRVVFIDDASNDGTFEKAQDFIVENNQDHRVILIRNETRLGPIGSLYRAIGSCLDREIAIPLDAKDWLAHPGVLTRLNAVYQNPDVWLAWGQAIQYPSYQLIDAAGKASCSFYAALMKQVRLEDLLAEGSFCLSKESYLAPLAQMAGLHARSLAEPLAFANSSTCPKQEKASREISSYQPLDKFPQIKNTNF